MGHGNRLRQQARWQHRPLFCTLPEPGHPNVSAPVPAGRLWPRCWRLVQQTGANPAQIKLELTESLLLANVDSVIATMRALKAHGWGFPFGRLCTGYSSSLSYLKRLPLDQIKIDQGFVRTCCWTPATRPSPAPSSRWPTAWVWRDRRRVGDHRPPPVSAGAAFARPFRLPVWPPAHAGRFESRVRQGVERMRRSITAGTDRSRRWLDSYSLCF